MKIRIFVNPSRIRNWHLALATSLSSIGHEVAFAFREGGRTLPAAYSIWLALERRIYRLSREHLSCRIGFAEIGAFLADMPAPNLVIDLTILPSGVESLASVLTLHFDGDRSEAAAISQVISGGAPRLSVATASGNEVMSGLPAVEKPHSLAQAMDHIFARCITLLVKSVAGHDPSHVPPIERLPKTVAASGLQITSFVLTSLLTRIARKTGLIPAELDQWEIGWREVSRETATPGLLSYGWLFAEAGHYYADPFPVDHGARTYVFFEDYPIDTGKGVISYIEIDGNGRASRPLRVLERPYHLSYPCIISHDGEFWMIPETYANRAIELYRATRFPDEWVLDCVLVEGVDASDTTIVEHNDRFWLFATVSDGGSTWDCLSIWSSSVLNGPWIAHPQNPVMVDSRGARPAGHFLKRDGRLLRPVQNCSRGYGGGVAMKEIIRLDERHFEERFVDDFFPGLAMPEGHVHTFNRSHQFELIDRLRAINSA